MALTAIARAKAAGYTALVVTIDTPVAGLRERDLRNGIKELLSRQPFAMLPYLPQILARPRWLAAFLGDGGLMKFPNIVLRRWPDGLRRRRRGARAVDGVVGRLPAGFATPGTARSSSRACTPPTMRGGAMDVGAAAIVVSNHGARQLDGVAPTIRVLPEVVTAVGDQIEVLLDGGIRRGSDVVKALCLGARAVLIGRAYAYGLGAAGEAGVARAIDILRTDVVRTMKLLGCASVAALDESFVDARGLAR